MSDGRKTFKKPFGPRMPTPRPLQGEQRPIFVNNDQVSFDPNAFRNFINSQGIKVVHFRAIPDPTGFNSRGDNHGVEIARKSVDNYIYEEAGEMQVLFSNNSMEQSDYVEGAVNYSTAYITLPEYYESAPQQPVLVMPWDRFYLKDIQIRVVTREKVESSSTGTDRLQYPATAVEFLRDANGNNYEEGEHFKITKDGYIEWISQIRPGWNEKQGRGTVYAIRYRYTPFFVCSEIIHEIRISQITNPMTYERNVVRMPYQIRAVRENVFKDMNNQPETRPTDDPRFDDAPPSGGFLGPTE